MEIKKLRNKKSFVLSLDALLAVVIFIMVTSSAVYHFSTVQEKTAYIYSFKEVNDAGAVLSKIGLLDLNYKEEAIEATNKMIPNYNVKFNVTNMNLTTSTKQSQVFGETVKEPRDVVIPARIFFNLKNETGGIVGFGFARITAWKD